MSDEPENNDAEIAAWKQRHGIDPAIEVNQDELRMAGEETKSKAKAWCFGCDKYMPVCEMKLLTRRVDPYVQFDEGETDYIVKDCRVRMCHTCFKEKYES